MIDRRTLVAAGLAAIPGAACAQGAARWEPRADIPWPVQEVYGTEWNGRAVIAGGMAPRAGGLGGGINPQDRTGLYDPAADAWTEGPRLPFPRHHPVLATAAGRPYAFGGFQVTDAGGWVAIKDALVLDGDAWRAVAPMPAFQCETVAFAIGDRIHLVSGRAPRGEANRNWQDQGDIALHQVYDAQADVWSTARPSPLARNSATGAVIDGKLYLAGGRRVGEGNSGQLDRYDPATDRWETLAPMPVGAGGLAGAAAGGRFYVFGGETSNSVIPHCWSYDPARDAWREELAMRTPRHGLAGVAIGDRIYAIGGGVRASGGQVSAVVEALVPA
ncbi:MAG: Kelch repeat-containing protein [Phenylobacterium sp.]|uniref:Kelch repeat-containing protein n=1 Tax=Phenylobacterium sp. TaxID=1871053 RepID=UPI00391B9086